MSHPTGIAYAEASAILRRLGAERLTPSASVALTAARGMVLGETVCAPLDLPPFVNSAMDGYAFRAADLPAQGERVFRLIGTQHAGVALPLQVGEGECVGIMTGAPLPPGADTVAIKENVRREGDAVSIAAGLAQGTNIRAAGSDCRAGSEIGKPGASLTPALLGLIAALGLATVPVRQRPSVAVFSTGDELKPPGSILAPGEIYDSNRSLLQALLAEQGIATLVWPALPDDPARLLAALSDAAEAYDIVITCGGVSAGDKDHLPALIAEHGRIHFWKVRMRPGMPVLCGELGRALFLGLPGNPVSVLANFHALVVPLLDAMQGRVDGVVPLRARLDEALVKRHDRLEFRRARVWCDDEGMLRTRPHPAIGSHQQSGAAESNALLRIPDDVRELAPGAIVAIHPYAPIGRG